MKNVVEHVGIVVRSEPTEGIHLKIAFHHVGEEGGKLIALDHHPDADFPQLLLRK